MLYNNDQKVLSAMSDIKDENPLKFTFQTCDFNEKLIKTLFNCSKEKLELEELNEINNESLRKYFVNKTALLDNMINSNDYFSQSLQSFFECNLKLFSKDEFLFFANCKNYLLLSKFIPKDIYSITMIIEKISHLKNRYYAEEIDENQFQVELICIMKEVYDIIFIDIYKEDTSVQYIFYKQIVLYKIGLYHSIISVLRLIKSDEDLLDFLINKEDLNEKTLNSIINVLKIMSYDNPFLISLNFNKSVLQYFFDKVDTEKKQLRKIEINESVLDFYIEQIKVLKKYNYKIEFRVIVDRIIPGIFKVYFLK